MAVNEKQLLKLKSAWHAIEEAKSAKDPSSVLWCIQRALNDLNGALCEMVDIDACVSRQP